MYQINIKLINESIKSKNLTLFTRKSKLIIIIKIKCKSIMDKFKIHHNVEEILNDKK